MLSQLVSMQAFATRAFKPEEAACMAPASAAARTPDARPAKRQKQPVQRVAADQATVVLEIVRMGAGLVQGVQVVERD